MTSMGQPVDAPKPAPITFDDFFRVEYPRVVGLAAVLCGRAAVAEELAQEAFVSVYRHWDRVAGYDDPGAWVRHVVMNLATSALRRRASEARCVVRFSRRRQPPTPDLPVDDDFWRSVRSLPRRQAQCIALHYLEDRSAEDIAMILEIATATVRVHLHHGRATLAERLGNPLNEETS